MYVGSLWPAIFIRPSYRIEAEKRLLDSWSHSLHKTNAHPAFQTSVRLYSAACSSRVIFVSSTPSREVSCKLLRKILKLFCDLFSFKLYWLGNIRRTFLLGEDL